MKEKNDLVYNIPIITSIAELVDHSAAEYAARPAFIEKSGSELTEISYARVAGEVRALAAYMCSLGLAGKRVALIGHNCRSWAQTYLAVCWGVGTIVPLDRDLKSEELENLLTLSEAAAIVYTDELEERVSAAVGKKNIVMLPASSLDEYVAEGSALLASGEKTGLRYINDPKKLGILLFTSGTTGVAKGVMLSQYNIVSNIMNVTRRVRIYPADRVLSVLPLHHTYECMAGFLSIFYSGGSIAYNESLRTLQSDLKLYKPTILVAVPLILETFHTKIMKTYAKVRGGQAALAFGRTLSSVTGREKGALAKKLFAPVHEVFGGRVRALLCGAAALSPAVFNDFEKFGFTVYNGYGLTETSPVCIMHNDKYRSPDDIGLPLAGVKIKLDGKNADGVGEICVKGPNVMLGYYNDPAATDAVIDPDGWFHTGDLACVKPNGAFRIVGRCKSMIVTAGGKKIFPEEVEHYINHSPLVSECLVYGAEINGEVQVCAAVVPDAEALADALAADGIKPGDPLYSSAEKKKIEQEVAAACRALPYFKAVRRVNLRRDEFIKTTTRKIKRFDPENLKLN